MMISEKIKVVGFFFIVLSVMLFSFTIQTEDKNLATKLKYETNSGLVLQESTYKNVKGVRTASGILCAIGIGCIITSGTRKKIKK